MKTSIWALSTIISKNNDIFRSVNCRIPWCIDPLQSQVLKVVCFFQPADLFRTKPFSLLMQELVISIQAKQAGKSNQAEDITSSEECIVYLNRNKKTLRRMKMLQAVD